MKYLVRRSLRRGLLIIDQNLSQKEMAVNVELINGAGLSQGEIISHKDKLVDHQL